MATLTITAGRTKFSLQIPHKILINGQFIGIMKSSEIKIQMPAGNYQIAIQSIIPYFGSTTMVKVEEGIDNILTFSDREKWWDILFGIDLILWFAKLFFELPHPWELLYKISTNGYFILWIIYELIIRKRYFKLDYQQKIRKSS